MRDVLLPLPAQIHRRFRQATNLLREKCSTMRYARMVSTPLSVSLKWA
jgi:hypothetical protein